MTGNRPVWLERVDGHAGWANSAALKAAGVTAATRDPAGGKVERNADGSPQGVLVDAAMEIVASRQPAPRPEDRDTALATAQQLLFKRGVTAVADMGTSIDDWQSYRRAGDANRLYVRIMAYAAGVENMTLIVDRNYRIFVDEVGLVEKLVNHVVNIVVRNLDDSSDGSQ